MLTRLHLKYPDQMKSHTADLTRYFLATCQTIEHLTPQPNLRNAVQGAKSWLKGEITDDEFSYLKWRAEASAFRMEEAKGPEDFEWLKEMVSKIPTLNTLPIEHAHWKLTKAAYFVDSAICYPGLSSAPFTPRLCLSEFLSADLLRDFVDPKLENWHEI